MRTKTLLLTAALVAAGVASSMAQSNVYSLNIVGYVNKVIPSGNSLLANPLSTGVTNGANEILPLVDTSVFLTWNGTAFVYASYDTGFGGWIDGGQNPSSPPLLPPGKGFFFFNPNPAFTNTFVGQVIPNPGTTNTLSLPSGNSLVGSVMPVAGSAITAPPVSLPLIDTSVILKWSGTAYQYFSYDTGFGGWIDAGQNATTEPGLAVAEGFFFFNPNGAAPWKQSLP
jgi:hypothetical protein